MISPKISYNVRILPCGKALIFNDSVDMFCMFEEIFCTRQIESYLNESKQRINPPIFCCNCRRYPLKLPSIGDELLLKISDQSYLLEYGPLSSYSVWANLYWNYSTEVVLEENEPLSKLCCWFINLMKLYRIDFFVEVVSEGYRFFRWSCVGGI